MKRKAKTNIQKSLRLGSLLGLLLALPATVQAQFGYTTNSGTITIGGCSESGAVVIPSTINGLPVTRIGWAAFQGDRGVTSVTIPNTIASIGEAAFEESGLTSVTIPNSVTNIGDRAFNACTALSAITVDASNSFYSSLDGALFDKSQTTLIQYPNWKGGGSYTIPNGVTSIEDWAFFSCARLASVTIPNSVTNIGDDAFCECTSLTSVTIPNSVTSLGGAAFGNCMSLAGVTIGDSVTGIGAEAFAYCSSLTSVTIPNSATSVGGGSFLYCASLTNITIGNGVTTIGQGAFAQCSMATLTIPDSVTSIGESAFYNCANLAIATIGDGVTSIGFGAFEECANLTSVYFQGNAPSFDPNDPPFNGDAVATVYYLPGTTGWGPFFAGRPTALWNPHMQSSGAIFGVRANGFGFTVTGTGGLVIVVEACTNLANPAWLTLGTNTLTSGSAYFSDPQWTNHPARFYRLRWP